MFLVKAKNTFTEIQNAFSKRDINKKNKGIKSSFCDYALCSFTPLSFCVRQPCHDRHLPVLSHLIWRDCYNVLYV